MERAPSGAELPDELLFDIFVLLDPDIRDYKSLRLVSETFYAITRDKRIVSILAANITAQLTQCISPRYSIDDMDVKSTIEAEKLAILSCFIDVGEDINRLCESYGRYIDMRIFKTLNISYCLPILEYLFVVYPENMVTVSHALGVVANLKTGSRRARLLELYARYLTVSLVVDDIIADISIFYASTIIGQAISLMEIYITKIAAAKGNLTGAEIIQTMPEFDCPLYTLRDKLMTAMENQIQDKYILKNALVSRSKNPFYCC